MAQIEFDVECQQCGNKLEAEWKATRRLKPATPYLEVEACEACQESADEEGYERGKKEAAE